MSVLISSETGADSKNLTGQQLESKKAKDFSSYCKSCEFSDWCDKKNKPFMLQSTVDANELYNELEDSESVNLDELPDKIYQLKLTAARLFNDLSKDKK